jgi:hypothetical protein
MKSDCRGHVSRCWVGLILILGLGAELIGCSPADLLSTEISPSAQVHSSGAVSCLAATGTNGATFVSQSVPGQVAAGRSFLIQVTMLNSGTTTWSPFATHGYFLGSQGPQDNFRWGTNRGAMDPTACIAPGQSYTFTVELAAPTAAGKYKMQWQLLQEGVLWFGGKSPSVDISVVNPGTSGVQNSATFVSQVVPSAVVQGSDFDVQVTMLNSGDATWTLAGSGASDGYYVGSQSPQDNFTWGTNRGFMTAAARVAPGQSYSFRFSLRAPAAPGTYSMQWQMLQNAVAWFGQLSLPLTITVTGLPPAPTRAQVGAVKMTFQGLTVNLPGYGSIPWFEPAISSLDAANRQLVYAAKHAAGDTHLIVSLSWNYSGDGRYSYPIPGTDLSGNLPAFRALVQEIIANHFIPLVFLAGDGESRPGGGYNDPVGWTYGYKWLMDHLADIVGSLQRPTDLTPYLVIVPGWDGVIPGWAPDASNPASGIYKYPAELDNYLLKARALLPNGYLGVELSAGYCHWGDGAANYSSSAGRQVDIILQEFPGPPTGDQVWQIAARELGPAYVRPPDQPAGDDRSPPFYLSSGTPRGPFYPIAFEYDEYRWVRGAVTTGQVQREQTYLKSAGYSFVN